jgi:Icc-related predicted phosphoesterase
MRILALSDKIVDFLYDSAIRERIGPVDVVVGCGDLPAYYLEYVVTQLNVPLLYVPGNHDPDVYDVQGCESIDGRWVRVKGVRFAGLGGSLRYKSDGRHQYTEQEMFYRVVRLLLTVRMGRRGLDILVTHAPPLGVHDAPDRTHTGFAAFHTFIQRARPRLLLHGHTHVLRNLVTTDTVVMDTRVLNVYPYRVIDLDETP